MRHRRGQGAHRDHGGASAASAASGSGPPAGSGRAAASGAAPAFRPAARQPSLEALVETGVLDVETLHPGGLETSRELARMCGIEGEHRVLDVASGTGETACWLAATLGSSVVGVDASFPMLRRSREKAAARGLHVPFVCADAHRLPFREGTFDAALSECTLSLLRKDEAVGEMVRVTRAGGRVGFHELCWVEGAPRAVRRRLVELEGERPETLAGWKRLLEDAGLEAVEGVDRSSRLSAWLREEKRDLGLAGLYRAVTAVLSRWGLRGLRRVLASARLFRSEHLGYGIVVGRKPATAGSDGPEASRLQCT